jgi:hypothetical protein
MEKLQQKHFIMPTNGTHSGLNKYFDWKTIVGSIATALIVGNFAYAWNTNATVARILEKQDQQTHLYDDVKGDLNQLQLDTRDLRERAIRTERLTEYNYQQLQKPTK